MELTNDRDVITNKHNNGIFIAVLVNIGSLFIILFAKNANIKNPINIFIGALAIATENGSKTISQ